MNTTASNSEGATKALLAFTAAVVLGWAWISAVSARLLQGRGGRGRGLRADSSIRKEIL